MGAISAGYPCFSRQNLQNHPRFRKSLTELQVLRRNPSIVESRKEKGRHPVGTEGGQLAFQRGTGALGRQRLGKHVSDGNPQGEGISMGAPNPGPQATVMTGRGTSNQSPEPGYMNAGARKPAKIRMATAAMPIASPRASFGFAVMMSLARCSVCMIRTPVPACCRYVLHFNQIGQELYENICEQIRTPTQPRR